MGRRSENSSTSLQISQSSCQLISRRVGLRSSRLALEKSIDLNEDKRKSGGFGSIGWQGLCEMYISKSLWSDRGVSDTET